MGIDYTNLETWIKAILVTAITAYLILSNPMLDGFSTLFQGVVNVINPDNTFTARSFVLFLAAIGLFALFVMTMRTENIWIGIVVIITLTFVTEAYTIFSGTLGEAIDSEYIACIVSNPFDSSNCATGTSEIDSAEKIGDTAIADVRFDTSAYGTTIFRTSDGTGLNMNLYSIPLVVSDSSDTNTVKNFYIVKSEVYNSSSSSRSSDKKLLATLTPDRCSDDNPCTVEPGDEITVNLRGDGIVEDAKSTSAEVRVTYSYDYLGEGQNDLIIAGNIGDLKEAQATSEGGKKFEGPMDVTVYFLPTYILADSDNLYEGVTYVRVYLSKSDDSAYARIRSPINITMIYTGNNIFSDDRTCETSWSSEGEEVVIEKLSGTSTYETYGVTFGGTTLSVEQQLSCKYPYNLTEDDVAQPKDIKFIVRVDYSFIDKITKSGITIREIGLE